MVELSDSGGRDSPTSRQGHPPSSVAQRERPFIRPRGASRRAQGRGSMITAGAALAFTLFGMRRKASAAA